MSSPWFEEAFRAGYLRVYPHRDLPSARREVAGLLASGLTTGGRVLDLGCGFGRHSLALLEAGVEVFGLDLSFDLLTSTDRLENGERLRGRLVRGDFRRLPFRDRSFDAVVMLFSSFGYFDDAGNAAMATDLARLLRPNGRLVLDLMSAARIRANLVPESRTERDGFVLEERRQLTDSGRRVVKDVRLVEPGGEERSWREDVRLFDPAEIAAILGAAGLTVTRTTGDFAGTLWTPFAERQIVWAEVAPEVQAGT